MVEGSGGIRLIWKTHLQSRLRSVSLKYILSQYQTRREVDSCHEENGNFTCWTYHVRIAVPKSTRAVHTATDRRQQVRIRWKTATLTVRNARRSQCLGRVPQHSCDWTRALNWTVITMLVRTGVTLHEATERSKSGRRRAQLSLHWAIRVLSRETPPYWLHPVAQLGGVLRDGQWLPTVQLRDLISLVLSRFLGFVHGPRLSRFVLTSRVLERTHWRFWCDLLCQRAQDSHGWRHGHGQVSKAKKTDAKCRRSGEVW